MEGFNLTNTIYNEYICTWYTLQIYDIHLPTNKYNCTNISNKLKKEITGKEMSTWANKKTKVKNDPQNKLWRSACFIVSLLNK